MEKNKGKTLILYYNTNTYFFPYVKTPKLDCQCVYKKVNKVTALLRRIPLLAQLVYGDWKERLDDYSKVIIFDNAYDKNIGSFLKRKAKSTYVYFWNPLITPTAKEMLRTIKSDFPVYSFDKQNCKEFRLKYASMVYSRDVLDMVRKDIPIKRDLIFVGWEKGRRDELYRLYHSFQEIGVNCLFIIIAFQNENIADDFVITDKGIAFEKYLELVESSRIMLDLQQAGQEGLTIRIVESMFFEKKIITNKIDIDTYDFYNSANIFILGKDDIRRLKSFVESPYSKVPEKIINKYDIKFWVDEYFC